MIFNLALEEQRVLIPVFAARRSSISAIIHSFWGSSSGENYAEMLFQLGRGHWSNTMKQSGTQNVASIHSSETFIEGCQQHF